MHPAQPFFMWAGRVAKAGLPIMRDLLQPFRA
ncbi:hypothetical protein RD1_1996 [Roseobacter denitrificans OCh 114]|uniref:Uncharacterized protein n=1 Tax=Roseobacter denitrificans (strain ATCC 33942 / OCh 114) TaxID=375451 RepID=Q168J3_ROSDO|nr:hypothetical protein RD1_1996 [Roseobacter denitrificans OCh 114]